MNDSFTNVVGVFSKRFEPNGAAYLFRAKPTAPGIPVSAAERDGFVAEYKRASRWILWGGVGLMTVVAIAVSVALEMSGHERTGSIALCLVLGLGTALCLSVNQWLFGAPARALRYRAPTSPARTKADARRTYFRQMTWSYILGMAAVGGAAGLGLAPKHDLLVGWNKLWLVGLGVYALLFASLAFRKWRADKSGQADG